MGDYFGINWFVPLKQGGFRRFFNKHISQRPLNVNNSSNNQADEKEDYDKKNN